MLQMANNNLGLNKQDIKEKNRGKLLGLIATNTCNTRIELSRMTGLSKMAVSNIISNMIASGIIAESETDPKNGQGRNPIKLCIAPTAPKIAGMFIFRGYCEAILCEMNLNIIRRERLPMDRVTPENFTNLVYSLLDTVILNETNVIGIGVASIGPIDSANGIILSPNYFYGIHNVPIVEQITDRYHLPVFFDQDNHSGALAELLFGNGRNHKDILLIGVSDGVGGGIISDYNLHSNDKGLFPEIGHVSIDYNGPKCACGNRGCLETYIRTPLVLSKLQSVTGKYYSYQQFCEIADSDTNVDKIFIDAIERMSMALVNVLNILNSEIILLGYDCIYWKDQYIELLEKKVNARMFSKTRLSVKVKKTYFGTDSQILGSVCNVISHIASAELLLETK